MLHTLFSLVTNNILLLSLSLSCFNQNFFFFFWIRGNLTSRKAHFVGPGERVKPRLSQALTRGARPDSNTRPAVQISIPLPSRYAPWGLVSIKTLNNNTRKIRVQTIHFFLSRFF